VSPLVPQAALNYVQVQRAPYGSVVECEAVARLRAPVNQPLQLLNPEGLSNSPDYSQIALVGAPRVALTGAQLAFRYQDDDARLAFQRLGKDLEPVGASLQDVAMSNFYPLSDSIGGLIRKVRFEFYDKTKPPASTMLPFQGLPALDASFAMDVVAVLQKPQ
jgi:enamine deaminase RidA (YjgF/YER057c/UK114 family)